MNTTARTRRALRTLFSAPPEEPWALALLDDVDELVAKLKAERKKKAPIPMFLWCPSCGDRHIDRGEFATKPHHTHACQSCGMVWRPALVPTVGVQFLPGFKDTKIG